MSIKNKFTLLECLIIFSIVCILGYFICLMIAPFNDEDVDYVKYMNPAVSQAITMEKMAKELTRQNDLNQKRLELMEQQKGNK